MRTITYALAVLAAGSATTAMAGTQLLSPNPAEVQKVSEIRRIVTVWDTDDAGIDCAQITAIDASGNTVATFTGEGDFDNYSQINYTTQTAVTEPGAYTVIIPANASETLDNDEIRISYVIEADNSLTTAPAKVDPAPGNITFSAENPFTQIRIEFANAVWFDADAVTFTGNGTSYPVTLGGWPNPDMAGMMWEYVDKPFVNVTGFNDGTLPSGTYTLTFPAGSVGTQAGPAGNKNAEALIFTWNYDANKVEADPTPLQMLSAQIVKVVVTGSDQNYNPIYGVDPNCTPIEFTNGMAMPDLTPEDGLMLELNHGAKSGYIEYTLYDGNNEIWLLGRMYKTADSKCLFVPVFNLKFDAGVDYRFEVRTYSEENSQLRVEHGDGLVLNFTGSNQAYEYSPYTFVAAAPDPDRAVISKLDDRTITLVYSGPVKIDKEKTSCMLGMTMTAPFEKIEPKTQRAQYDAVWFLTIPESVVRGQVGVNMSVFAVDEEGRAVKGNAGTELNSWNEFAFELAYFQPRIVLTESSVRLPEIEKIRISAENRNGNEVAINCSWMAYPELRDKDGNKVAGIIQDYDEEWGMPYKEIRTSGGSEPDPLELEFCLDTKITTPGKYTLHFPKYCFALGTQFDGQSSVEQDFDLWVTAHHNVTYTVDNHTMTLAPVVTGHSATVNLEPAEGWKVNCLTFNGKEVTDQYADGKYTTPALSSDAAIAVEFAYDGAVVTPSGMNEVVTDLELRGWASNGKLYVAGLKAGQKLDVFTAGGAKITTMDVPEGMDTAEINVPEGVYIVTVAEGETRVALKLAL